MITTKQAIDAAIRYLDTRIVNQLPAGKAAIIGGFAIWANRHPDKAESIALNKFPIVMDMGLFKDGLWDADEIYQCFAPQIRGRIDVDIPAIGNLSIDREEVDILYKLIGGIGKEAV